MIETNIDASTNVELRWAAKNLLDAAMTYWESYCKVSGGAAVVWLKDSDGRMVVLTRGEYKTALMQNIDQLGHNVTRFD